MNRTLNRAANLFILLLSMLSLCVLMRDSFSLRLEREAFLWLGLLCLLLWFAETFRYGTLVGLPLCGAALWYLYRERSEDLLAETKDLLDHISAVYYGHYTAGAVPVVEGTAAGHMVPLLFAFFVLAAFVAAALCSGGFRVSLTVLATLPVFALCVAVNGAPEVLPVLGFLLSLAGLRLGGDVFREGDGAGRALFLGLVPCLAVLSALLLLYNPDTYQPTEHDIDLSQRFDKLGNALAEWMSEDTETQETAEGGALRPTSVPRTQRAPSGWDQGRDELDLSARFDASALSREAFLVTADTEGSLYFRGRSYGDYRGSSWSAATENQRGNALSFVGQAIAQAEGTVTGEFQLNSPAPYDVLYLPYYSISSAAGDVRIPSEGYSSYGGVYYNSGIGSDALAASVTLPPTRRSEEQAYREYAHSYYTRLPDSTRSALAAICDGQDWSASQDGILWRVADYVRRQGVYDVNVGAYPSEDYAVYFLTQSHTGYCIHFATAAAALYRTLGIPARVCEGYLVNNLQAGQAMRVTGGDAHAWVEVYVDGLGWVPVEVTASAAEGDWYPAEGSVAPTPEPAVPERQEPEEHEGDPDGDGEQPEEPEAPGEDDASADAETPSGAGGQGDTGVSDKTQPLSPAARRALWALTVLAGLTAAVGGRYLILRELLRRRLAEPDGRKRAVNLYRQAERVLRYGGEMPEELQQTAEKARFSQHEITEEELARGRELLDGLTAEVEGGLSRWKRFAFRVLSGNR